jgi:hypothetical protein
MRTAVDRPATAYLRSGTFARLSYVYIQFRLSTLAIMSSFDTFHWPTHSGLVNVILALVLVVSPFEIPSSTIVTLLGVVDHVDGRGHT